MMTDLVRLWDKDFNLLYQYQGNPEDLFNNMHVTVDYNIQEPNWRQRTSGRIHSATVHWHGRSFRPDTDPT